MNLPKRDFLGDSHIPKKAMMERNLLGVYFLFFKGFETTCLAFYTPENTLCKPGLKLSSRTTGIPAVYVVSNPLKKKR